MLMTTVAESYKRYKNESMSDLQGSIDKAVKAYQDPNISAEKKGKVRELIKGFQKELKIRELVDNYKERGGLTGDGEDGVLDTIGRYFDTAAQNITGGYLEEATAGIKSLFSDKDYSELLENEEIKTEFLQRAKDKYDSATGHAVTGLAGEVASLVIPGGAVLKGTNKLSKAIKANPFKSSIAAGTGYAGALGASGPGTGEERLSNAIDAAPWGAVGGAATPWVGRALSKFGKGAQTVAANPGTAGAAVGGGAAAGAEAYDQATDPNKEFSAFDIAKEGGAGAVTGFGAGKGLAAGAKGLKGLLGNAGETIAQTGSRLLSGGNDKTAKFGGLSGIKDSHIGTAVDKTPQDYIDNTAKALKSIIWGNIQSKVSTTFFKGKGWGAAGKLQAATGKRSLMRELKDFVLAEAAKKAGYKSPAQKAAIEKLKSAGPEESLEIMTKAGMVSKADAAKIKVKSLSKDLSQDEINKVNQAVSELGQPTPGAPEFAIGGLIGKFATKYGQNLYHKLVSKGLNPNKADEVASSIEAKVGGVDNYSTTPIAKTYPNIDNRGKEFNKTPSYEKGLLSQADDVPNKGFLEGKTPYETIQNDVQSIRGVGDTPLDLDEGSRISKGLLANVRGAKSPFAKDAGRLIEPNVKSLSVKELKMKARQYSKEIYVPAKNRTDFNAVNWAEAKGYPVGFVNDNKIIAKHYLDEYNKAAKATWDADRKSGGKFGKELKVRAKGNSEYVEREVFDAFKIANPSSKASTTHNPDVVKWAKKNGKKIRRRSNSVISDHTAKKPSKALLDQLDRERVGVLETGQTRDNGWVDWNHRGEAAAPHLEFNPNIFSNGLNPSPRNPKAPWVRPKVGDLFD